MKLAKFFCKGDHTRLEIVKPQKEENIEVITVTEPFQSSYQVILTKLLESKDEHEI